MRRLPVLGVVWLAAASCSSPARGTALDAHGVTAILSERGAELALGRDRVTISAAAIGRGPSRSSLVTEATPSASRERVRTPRGRGVVEWWREAPGGLEHGVDLHDRLPGTGPLVVELAVGGGLSPQSLTDDAVALTRPDGSVAGTYAHLDVRDAAGARVGAWMRALDGRIVIEVDDRGAPYPLVIDPLVATEEALLTAPDRAANDWLGISVDLAADSSRAVVGAYTDDTTAVDSGSARVFLRTGTVWAHEATLVASDAGASDSFARVAMSGDGLRVIVGSATDDRPAGADVGSAHVFVRAGTVWTEEAVLTASDAAVSDYLGGRVAISFDGSVAIVGASGDDVPGAFDGGSARVYSRSGSVWSAQATLVAPDRADMDRFGCDVDLSADGSRALVGAVNGDSSMADAGSAYVFLRTGTTWAIEATLTDPSFVTGDQFGNAVALVADGTRAAIGAYHDDTPGGANAGSVRVFARSGTTWTAEGLLTASGGAADDELGIAVAISPDGTRVLAGAYLDDTVRGNDGGSALVFLRAGTVWTEDVLVVPAVGHAGASFGTSAALAADGRALVGAYAENVGPTTGAGTARVYTLGGAPNGTACSTDSLCASGHCADGVCCDTACGGGATDCQACTAALTGAPNGTCAALSASSAPTVVCRAATGTCAREAATCRKCVSATRPPAHPTP